MMKHSNFLFSILLSTILIVGASVARAETLPTPMDSNALAAASGLGTATSDTNTAEVNSAVSSNTIGNVGYTGGISNISASNNSGLTTLIENTGNQVSISTATVVTVNYH